MFPCIKTTVLLYYIVRLRNNMNCIPLNQCILLFLVFPSFPLSLAATAYLHLFVSLLIVLTILICSLVHTDFKLIVQERVENLGNIFFHHYS